MPEGEGDTQREKISVLLPVLEEALLRKGCLSGPEACRLLLKLPRVPPETASALLEAALDQDRRFLLLEDGSVCLAPRAELHPLPLDRVRFTVVDVETTGGSAAQDRILEIGAVRVEHFRPAAEFGLLLDPGIPIPPFISAMTGIRDEMVAGAPCFKEVAEDFLRFLGDSVLVAHNLPFDLEFLNRELSRSGGFVLSNAGLCTVRLGRRLLSQLPDRRLDTVADYYGIPIEARHRALGDARATARILIRLLEELAERGIQRLDHLDAFLNGGKPGSRGPVTGRKRPRRAPRGVPPSAES